MSTTQFDLVVLGAGESGVGAALLGQSRGLSVFVSDLGGIADKYKAELEEHQIPYEERQHTEEIILSAREVVKSPGIPDKAPIIQKLLAQKTPILSEIELAGRYLRSGVKVVGISGSNGKTTTTMWLHHILTTAERHRYYKEGLQGEPRVALAGNVGFSLARQVCTDDQPDYFVVELSSFQLDNMYHFHLDLALLMNITPDHLDRYDYSFEKYALSKMRLLQNQTESDAFIYWGEDEFISRYVLMNQPLKPRLLPFVTYPQGGAAAYRSDDNRMCIAFDDVQFSIPVSELALQGPHNLQNAMAASIAALRLGVPSDILTEALREFTNVPHRLELIRLLDGVRYINDSKATNINSTYYALRTMTTPYVLILGGTDKGNDYSTIADLIVSSARAVIFLTKDTEKLHRTFDGRIPVEEALSMQEAIEKCRRYAQLGDTVLLSPACASFDLFRNYEDRGDQFRTAVLSLPSNTPN